MRDTPLLFQGEVAKGYSQAGLHTHSWAISPYRAVRTFLFLMSLAALAATLGSIPVWGG